MDQSADIEGVTGLQAPEALRRSLHALLLQLAQASAVGLIDLKVAESAVNTPEAQQAAQIKGSGHDRSLESCMEQAKLTGASLPVVIHIHMDNVSCPQQVYAPSLSYAQVLWYHASLHRNVVCNVRRLLWGCR